MPPPAVALHAARLAAAALDYLSTPDAPASFDQCDVQNIISRALVMHLPEVKWSRPVASPATSTLNSKGGSVLRVLGDESFTCACVARDWFVLPGEVLGIGQVMKRLSDLCAAHHPGLDLDIQYKVAGSFPVLPQLQEHVDALRAHFVALERQWAFDDIAVATPTATQTRPIPRL